MMNIQNELRQADELYRNNKFLEASFSYQEILRNISGKKISEQDKNLIKNRLKESILKSHDEYKTLSTEIKLDEAMIEKINAINEGILRKTSDDLSNLLPITFSSLFIGSYKKNEQSAQKSIPISYQIANLSTRTDQGHLLANNEDYSPLELWSFQTYEMEQTMKVLFHVNPIFKKLTENKVIGVSNFISLLNNKGLYSKGNEHTILQIGLKSYLEKDYVSALHTIIPQFENLLLDISEKSGFQTSVIERGKALTKRLTLSDRELKSEEMLKIFGQDYCFYLRYILYSPLGLSLRHKVAHGTIAFEECSESNCNLILVSLFILLDKIRKA